MSLKNPKYPGIVRDYEMTFARQHAMQPDIWVAAHASQFGLAEKVKSGNFVDPAGFAAAVDRSEKAFREKAKQKFGK
jgi:metallo-beta-lactamase class B